MTETLRKTWDDIASNWDDWGPPLRPSAEDLRIMRAAVVRWHADGPVRGDDGAPRQVRVFLCGVTPEIAAMDWPFPIDLVGMDQAESMVRIVWPGDVPGVRRAMVGNWLESGLEPHSRDVVIGDGGVVFFDYPQGQRTLTAALHRLLKAGGLLVYRDFAGPRRRETLAEVFDAMRAGRISSFHAFKWRVAMAIQPDSRRGVRQDDVWRACMEAAIEPAKLPQPGWSPRAIDTIRFYRGKESRLYFPTVDEFRDLLAERFEDVQVVIPSYELGERCPILAGRARAE